MSHRPHYVPFYYNHPRQQQFPAINPDAFMNSARMFQGLMNDANRILNRIQGSRQFATQLKDAAQQSDQAKVNQLVTAIGLQSEISTTFTPTAIIFDLSQPVDGTICCSLSMVIRW